MSLAVEVDQRPRSRSGSVAACGRAGAGRALILFGLVGWRVGEGGGGEGTPLVHVLVAVEDDQGCLVDADVGRCGGQVGEGGEDGGGGRPARSTRRPPGWCRLRRGRPG